MAFHRGPDLKPARRALRRLGYSWKQVAEVLEHISEFGTVENCPLLAPDDRITVEGSIPDSGFWSWKEFDSVRFNVASEN